MPAAVIEAASLEEVAVAAVKNTAAEMEEVAGDDAWSRRTLAVRSELAEQERQASCLGLGSTLPSNSPPANVAAHNPRTTAYISQSQQQNAADTHNMTQHDASNDTVNN